SRNKQRPTVDLPHPDSPTSPRVSPWKISNETPSTARTTSSLPSTAKCFTRPRTFTSSLIVFIQVGDIHRLRRFHRFFMGYDAVLLQNGIEYANVFYPNLRNRRNLWIGSDDPRQPPPPDRKAHNAPSPLLQDRKAGSLPLCSVACGVDNVARSGSRAADQSGLA